MSRVTEDPVAALWPTTGLAIAALLVMGRWVWPGVFAAAEGDLYRAKARRRTA